MFQEVIQKVPELSIMSSILQMKATLLDLGTIKSLGRL